MGVENSQPGQLRGNAIGVFHIIFFVVAAAAPLTAIVGAAPFTFAVGNGAGAPSAYLMAGLIYLVFSVGFTAMSRHIGSAGAFYVFIARGLNAPAGIAAGAIAILTYFAIQIAVYALFGVVVAGLLQGAGIDLPWWTYTLACAGIVYFCGQRNVEFSGKILGICLIGEIAVLMVLNLIILFKGGGPEGINFVSFEPSVALSTGLGASLLFAVASFIGFEATAIFSEEAKDPKRTIPIATYAAVLLITLFYAFSAWCMILAYGPSGIRQAAEANLADLFTTTAGNLGGWLLKDAMTFLLVTSLFACVLSFHSTISRYFFAGGREGLLPAALARVNAAHASPYIAGRWQSIIVVALIALFAAIGLDPYTIIYSWMCAVSAIGILVVQIIVAMSVIGFFYNDHRDTTLWHRMISPLLSIAGLGACLVLVIFNLPLLAGSDSLAVKMLPVLVVATGVVGAAMAMRIKKSDPSKYSSLGRNFVGIAQPSP